MASGESTARRWIAGILVVLGIILSTVALVAVWSNLELTSPDQFISLVAPLAADPAVREAIGDQITEAITTKVATAPESAETSPVTDALRQRIVAEVQAFLDSERFAQLWQGMLGRLHEALLSGDGSSVSVTDGQVVVDLGPLVAEVETQLAERGIDVAGEPSPPEDLQFVLFSSPALATAVDLIALIERLAILLPGAAIAVFLVSLLVAERRGRLFVWAGFGLALMMALLVLGTAVAGRASTVAADDAAIDQIGAVLLDAVLASLRIYAALLGLVALAIAAIGLLLDRRRRAEQARR